MNIGTWITLIFFVCVLFFIAAFIYYPLEPAGSDELAALFCPDFYRFGDKLLCPYSDGSVKEFYCFPEKCMLMSELR